MTILVNLAEGVTGNLISYCIALKGMLPSWLMRALMHSETVFPGDPCRSPEKILNYIWVLPTSGSTAAPETAASAGESSPAETAAGKTTATESAAPASSAENRAPE